MLVAHGGTEMGQGLHTKMVQVAAHTLGIDHNKVRKLLHSSWLSQTSCILALLQSPKIDH